MAKSIIFCIIDSVTCIIALLIMKLFQNSEIIDDQLVFLIVFVIGWIGTRIIFKKRMNRQKKEREVIVINCPICNQTSLFKEGEELKCTYCNQY